MSLEIPAVDNSRSKPVSVAESVFGQAFNEPLVHQLVVGYLAAGRFGTSAQKTRSEVSGGGKKPWKQKGSGRARAGTTRGPLWRTGGVTFASKTRSYSQKLNKKMYRSAMRSIFSELLRQGRLAVSDEVRLGQPKTKALLGLLDQKEKLNTVIITEDVNLNLYLAARNIPWVEVQTPDALSPVALVQGERVIVTSGAAKLIEARLS